MTLSAAAVSVRAGSAQLLVDVHLAIEPGEVVAVAGPNGAGKSTLVAVLAGDRRLAEGTVTLDGRDLRSWTRSELARRRAVMSPDPPIAFDFSVEDVVLMGRLPIHGGRPGPTDIAIARDLLSLVDAGHLARRSVATLSSGERQRVQLARAVAQLTQAEAAAERQDGPSPHPGRYLLLDEPTSSLDPLHQHVAMRLVRRVASDGVGILVVVHDLNLAAAYADRVALMSAGRVVACDAPATVLRPELLEAVFLVPMLVIEHPGAVGPVVVAVPTEDASRL
jgi:iron complex transport system ATP-binding protein